jgi:hypothetical protein
VVVLGVGLGVGFFITQLRSPSAPPLPSTTDLAPVPIAAAWQPMVHVGQPPADVLGNMVVPTGATATGFHNKDQGVGQYDRSVDFFVPAGEADVEGFYGAELGAIGWKIRAVAYTNDHQGRQVLAYRFSSDSYEWDAQLTIDNGTGRTSVGTTPGTLLTVELYQVSDDEG